MGKALDDGHQRQPAGTSRGEQRQYIKGRHRTKFIRVNDHAVFEPSSVFIRYGEELAREVLDHETGDEILRGVFFGNDNKDGAFARRKTFCVDRVIAADDLLELRVQKGIEL